MQSIPLRIYISNMGKLEDVQDGLEILSHASGREKLMEGELYSAVIDVELTG
jgi:hypothetical protein